MNVFPKNGKKVQYVIDDLDSINFTGQSGPINLPSAKSLEFDCNRSQYTFAVDAKCDYNVIIPVDW